MQEGGREGRVVTEPGTLRGKFKPTNVSVLELLPMWT